MSESTEKLKRQIMRTTIALYVKGGRDELPTNEDIAKELNISVETVIKLSSKVTPRNWRKAAAREGYKVES